MLACGGLVSLVCNIAEEKCQVDSLVQGACLIVVAAAVSSSSSSSSSSTSSSNQVLSSSYVCVLRRRRRSLLYFRAFGSSVESVVWNVTFAIFRLPHFLQFDQNGSSSMSRQWSHVRLLFSVLAWISQSAVKAG
ncbi:hypothetical protein T07_1247 [Trichinella nelsoni]|uniref:Uncharacterized protein n=1 Tax=Trichinella nelsoni TaxID=6336 RepID=A0A0V0RUI7_9BILA|nr:hypothetical protein T07_1247 [Trichinella nelsoni]